MQKQIDEDLEKTLFPDLRKLTNMPNNTTDEMHNVCNYIMWMKKNHRELKFNLTEEQYNQC